MKNLYIYALFLICFSAFCVTGCGESDSVIITAKDNDISVTEDSDNDGSKYDSLSGTADDTHGKTPDPVSDDTLYVYVCGHVVNPGVYELHVGDRIYDALELAGGVADDGRGDVLSQAMPVSDGQTIYVPGYDEELENDIHDFANTSLDDVDDRVNINTAGREELMELPGIGESKAADIIRYREEHGNFTTIEDLMEITGIKEGVFNKIKDRIKV